LRDALQLQVDENLSDLNGVAEAVCTAHLPRMPCNSTFQLSDNDQIPATAVALAAKPESGPAAPVPETRHAGG